MRSASPPCAFGTSIALNPSSIASFLWRFSTSGGRRPSWSSASTSQGISSSVANLKARPCQSRAVGSRAMSMRSAPRVRFGLGEMAREHVRQVPQRDQFRTLAAHGIRPDQEVEPEAVREGGQAVGDERGLDLGVASLLAEPGADHAHHVVIGPVALRADPPVRRPEAALAPKREPDGKLVARANRAAEVELDHGEQPLDRGNLPDRGGFLACGPVFVRQVAQRLRQEPFLAAEMQVHDALAEARFLGHRGDRRVRESAVGDAADGGLYQLLAALLGGRRPAPREDRELTFRTHKKACLFSNLCEIRARTEATSYKVPLPKPMNEHIFTQNGRGGPVWGKMRDPDRHAPDPAGGLLP